ncbi:hypothetical protein GQ43DRAFT_97422 [Delitschia confertaspora ATCC 74209]|uniref:Arrestin-like N-terminal domain-containing protein n=1 Tax=Delitschia confertaspora ATCC 74209 TaxID=1513339 RepID=A0A9P4MNW2_9PLEO|nr:hypothetical protein GQ43DRAFT_97422 [Delitschia confertaspora ATCC 74209]
MGPPPTTLQVFIAGDPSRIYRPGDQVKGTVILVAQKQEAIKALTVAFKGTCITKLSKPVYVIDRDSDTACSATTEYQERANLFVREQILIPACTIGANQYSYDFHFTFPALTEARQSRWTYASRYNNGPHALPPSFHIYTNSSGGRAFISYFIKAKLCRGVVKEAIRTMHMLNFLPSSPPEALLEPILSSRVSDTHIIKPANTEPEKRTAIDKVIHKIFHKPTARTPSPNFIATLHFPDKVAPGQAIPLSLTLKNVREPSAELVQAQCTLESLFVVVSTNTRALCHRISGPLEDVVRKDVTCISRQNANIPLTFDAPTKLTHSLRLVEDAQSVPSFTTYSISREYTLNVSMRINYNDQKFTINSTTPLQILPRDERRSSVTRLPRDPDDVDPLPLYTLREPPMESAPEYEESIQTLMSPLELVPSLGGSIVSYPSTDLLTPCSSNSTNSFDCGSSSGIWAPETDLMTQKSEQERLEFVG